MAKAFASQGDLTEKKVRFTEVGRASGHSPPRAIRTPACIGDDAVMVVEAQATPKLASKVIDKVREVTDKPITHVVLTHYHAVRVLGAAAYGARQVSWRNRARHGGRARPGGLGKRVRPLPAPLRGARVIPGLTWPTTTFSDAHDRLSRAAPGRADPLGRAHTAATSSIWVPDQSVMFPGDIVEARAACYCGDGHFGDWPCDARPHRSLGVRGDRPWPRRCRSSGREAVDGALARTGTSSRAPTARRLRWRRRNGTLKECLGRGAGRMRSEVQRLLDL